MRNTSITFVFVHIVVPKFSSFVRNRHHLYPEPSSTLSILNLLHSHFLNLPRPSLSWTFLYSLCHEPSSTLSILNLPLLSRSWTFLYSVYSEPSSFSLSWTSLYPKLFSTLSTLSLTIISLSCTFVILSILNLPFHSILNLPLLALSWTFLFSLYPKPFSSLCHDNPPSYLNLFLFLYSLYPEPSSFLSILNLPLLPLF